jgi:hypothetical protein
MVAVEGFDSSKLFEQIASRLSTGTAAEKDAVLKKAKAIFQFDVKVFQINFRISKELFNNGPWI